MGMTLVERLLGGCAMGLVATACAQPVLAQAASAANVRPAPIE